jgi:hypothetical protein
MSTKKKKPTLGANDIVEQADGSIRLNFSRPHGALGVGAIIVLGGGTHHGPHKVERILNKFMVVVRKIGVPAPASAPVAPLRKRLPEALRVLIGNRRPKARA